MGHAHLPGADRPLLLGRHRPVGRWLVRGDGGGRTAQYSAALVLGGYFHPEFGPFYEPYLPGSPLTA